MKKIDIAEALETQQGKYFLEKRKGKNKKEAALAAGYADGMHTSTIEKSQTYLAVERYFKDELQQHITLNEIALELSKNIKQDQDRGAKNKAIELALDRIEPETAPTEREEAVMVVFKK